MAWPDESGPTGAVFGLNPPPVVVVAPRVSMACVSPSLAGSFSAATLHHKAGQPTVGMTKL